MTGRYETSTSSEQLSQKVNRLPVKASLARFQLTDGLHAWQLGILKHIDIPALGAIFQTCCSQVYVLIRCINQGVTKKVPFKSRDAGLSDAGLF